MLKLNTSFSKKVPIPGQEFTSQSFHASIEVELSDAMKPEEIKGRIHDTFAMVKAAVEDELAGNGKAKMVPPETVPENQVELPKGGDKASNKQLSYLTALATQQDIPISELNARVKELYGVASIYDLSKRDASRLVDSLKSGGRRKAA